MRMVAFVVVAALAQSALVAPPVPAGGDRLSLEDEWKSALSKVTVEELNAVHLLMIERMVDRIPKKGAFTIFNRGIVAIRTTQVNAIDEATLLIGGRRDIGSIGMPLHWDVVCLNAVSLESEIPCSLWISLNRTGETVGTVSPNGRALFVNLSNYERLERRKKRDELGGISLEDLCNLLVDPPAKR